MTLSGPWPVSILRPCASLYDVVQPVTSLYGGVDCDAKYARKCAASCIPRRNKVEVVAWIDAHLPCCWGIQGGRARVFQFPWGSGDTVVTPKYRLRACPYGCLCRSCLVGNLFRMSLVRNIMR